MPHSIQASNNQSKKRLLKYLSRIILAILFFHFYKNYDDTLNDGGIFIYSKRVLIFLLFFIAYFLLIWEGGIQVFRMVDKAHKEGTKFSTKALNLILFFIFYGIITSILFSSIYYLIDVLILKNIAPWDGIPFIHFDMNFGIFIYYLIIVTFLGYMYNYNHWNQERIKAEQLRRENIQSKYEALKNQIDPHFFFNSLTTLASLNIQREHDLSVKYINQLSKMYRYILDKDKTSLVLLNDELKFLESYIYLIRVRHKDFINFDIELSKDTKEKVYLPPLTLQILVENAVKHNKFTKDNPLRIYVKEMQEKIIVVNNLNRRLLIERSSEIGLQNIRKRYELLVNESISIKETNSEFIVELPKLFKQHIDTAINYTN